jgi:hypothetical protein
MVRKSQKSHGARSELYGGCSDGVSAIHFFQAEHRIQFRFCPLRFLDWTFRAKLSNWFVNVMEKSNFNRSLKEIIYGGLNWIKIGLNFGFQC